MRCNGFYGNRFSCLVAERPATFIHYTLQFLSFSFLGRLSSHQVNVLFENQHCVKDGTSWSWSHIAFFYSIIQFTLRKFFFLLLFSFFKMNYEEMMNVSRKKCKLMQQLTALIYFRFIKFLKGSLMKYVTLWTFQVIPCHFNVS